jgi:Ni,Fe-hydrogenase III large subunit
MRISQAHKDAAAFLAAYGWTAVSGVQHDLAEDFLNHVNRLVAKIETRVNRFVGDESGTPLFA